MSHERTPAQARQQRQANNKQQFQTDRTESKTLILHLYSFVTLSTETNIYSFMGILLNRRTVTE